MFPIAEAVAEEFQVDERSAIVAGALSSRPLMVTLASMLIRLFPLDKIARSLAGEVRGYRHSGASNFTQPNIGPVLIPAQSPLSSLASA